MDFRENIFQIASILMGLCSLSIASAILFHSLRRGRFQWFHLMFALFFAAGGLSRILFPAESFALMGPFELALHLVAGSAAVVIAIIIWPMSLRALQMPSVEDLQRQNEQLSRAVHEKEEAERRAHELAEQNQNLNRELNSRIYELSETNKALQTARDDALEASNLKSSFVANISHEIRTPLSGILGMIEILMETPLNEEQRDMAEMVQSSANNLLIVVNDILDLSKIEAGKVDFEHVEFDVIALVRDSTALLQSNAKGKKLQLRTVIDERLPDTVYGDPSRVRQVLINLIGNAVKFTDQGYVEVRSEVVQQTEFDINIRFTVVDTGAGLSPEEQKYLFRPFVQVDNSTTRKHGGTGLGLAISKRYVEMMGGRIGVESVKGKGSSFWFELPFDKIDATKDSEAGKVAAAAKAARAAAGRNVLRPLASNANILIVEDNPVLRELALRQLGTIGLTAVAVEDGDKAVAAARDCQFDLILMDVNLPGMSGLEAASAIREIEAETGWRTPIVAMTAGAMKGDRERAIEAGMDDYLAKPVTIEQLRAKVEAWLPPTKRRAAS